MNIMASTLVGLCLALGALAGVTAYGTWRAEQAYPPMGSFVQADGLRLHYVEQGTGRPLILLHGANTTLRDFQASILPLLARDHRVVAFDRPGSGYSERPSAGWPDPARQARLLRSALSKLGVQRPILVGHSWSGALVLAYLLQFPEDLPGAVLIAGATHPWAHGVASVYRLAGMPVVGALFARTLLYPGGRALMQTAIAEAFAPNPVPQGFAERTGMVLALRPASFLANAEDVRKLSGFLERQSRKYGEIRQPLLLITGDADRIVPAPNHSERLAKQARSAELVILQDTGHMPHHIHPEQVADLIHRFARSVP